MWPSNRGQNCFRKLRKNFLLWQKASHLFGSEGNFNFLSISDWLLTNSAMLLLHNNNALLLANRQGFKLFTASFRQPGIARKTAFYRKCCKEVFLQVVLLCYKSTVSASKKTMGIFIQFLTYDIQALWQHLPFVCHELCAVTLTLRHDWLFAIASSLQEWGHTFSLLLSICYWMKHYFLCSSITILYNLNR